MELGEEGDYYTYRYTVTTRMTPELRCRSDSDESHFNVALNVRDKVTRQCPQTTILEVKGKPRQIRTEVPLPAYQPTALPLGQTGSLSNYDMTRFFYTPPPPPPHVAHTSTNKSKIVSLNRDIVQELCESRGGRPGLSVLKPVLNWANVCSPEQTSDTSTNYDSFLN